MNLENNDHQNKETFSDQDAIFNGLPEPIAQIDESFQIIKSNSALSEFIKNNVPISENKLKCYQLIYKRENICPFCPLPIKEGTGLPVLENISQTGYHVNILHRNEQVNQTLSLYFYPIKNGDRVVSFVERIADITKNSEKEEENLRLRNLASLGIMISGVAHELNNPLTGIHMTVQNLTRELMKSGDFSQLERLKMIDQDLKRASSIVSDIISFAKPQKVTLTYSDISDTIYKAKETVERLFPRLCETVGWEIIKEVKNEFYFNPLKMERLFINLFRNSLQAIDYKPGKISIEIKKKKNNYQIVVEDNGGGIPQEIIDKVFDPFFTNKKDGFGSGLGLSVCHSIVKEHNGKINVKSFDNKTRFIITLPPGEKK